MKKESASFFDTLKYRDIKRGRKKLTVLAFVLCTMMFLVSVLSVLFAFSVAMKPTPVIAFDKDGRRIAFSGEETFDTETNKVRIHRFLTNFINKFDGVSPNVDEDLKEAYNMLTPKFRQILLDRSVHNEKIDMWKNKNFATDFRITRLKIIKGDFSAGSVVTAEGLGEMIFGNAVDYSGDSDKKKTFTWFSVLLFVVPVSFDLSPDGLLVEFYTGKSFDDLREQRAYLLENKKEYLLEDEEKEAFE